MLDMKRVIIDYGRQGSVLREEYFHEFSCTMNETAKCMVRCFLKGGKILVCGNGGSAADAQHFAAELVGRFLVERHPLPAVALSVDTSILTAVGNDYGYDHTFARQVEALGRKDDILVALSTSGNSANVLYAMDCAHALGMHVVGLCGKNGGSMRDKSDILFHVHSDYTPFIQEMHEATIHVLCLLIDNYLAAHHVAAGV